MTEIKEYTGLLRINLEVTLHAKSEKEALELLENIYPLISLSYMDIELNRYDIEDEIPELIDWDTHIDTAEWELED
ncbi:MAG: hypothetical protein PX635_19220 [Nostocales cyanobacterium LE14-WE12]|jgi:hypothetical protein|nr:hypothetical protein [Nostocales cyanobacterium LE14-WE12]